MKKIPLLLIIVFFLGASFTTNNTDEFKFKVEWAKINGSLWSKPYRYENKELKSLSIKITIERLSKNKALDFNYISLVNETNKTRIRPNAVYYLKGNDKKIYLKSKVLNKNYNAFKKYTIDGYKNLQTPTFKPNFLGLKKKNQVASIQSLKTVTIKNKITYFIDFPVEKNFSYGKVYYKDKPIGFAAIKK